MSVSPVSAVTREGEASAEPAPNSQHLWARAIVEELVHVGVRHAVVCPGSRSTPLAFAVAAQPGLRLWTVPDERSAAFLALGLGMATGVPAVVVVTSGTAGANCHPAFIEAHMARVPMVVLTADRPWELHGFGALQTMDQQRLFGAHGTFEGLPAPEMTRAALVHLRATVSRTAAACVQQRLPCHINVPFREPLAPSPEALPALDSVATHGRGNGPFVQVVHPSPAWDAGALAQVARVLGGARRGIFVAGPRVERGDGYSDAILSLAGRLGFPILAEATSGLRYHRDTAWVVSHYEAILRAPGMASALRPDVIVRVGGPVTTRQLQGFVDGSAATVVTLADEGLLCDPQHVSSVVLSGAVPAAAAALTQAIPASTERAYAQQWAALDRGVAQAWLDTSRPSDVLCEPLVAPLVVGSLPPGSALFVSSSMPIRDLDAFARARNVDLQVYCSRGVSGIDGILSTAFGVAAGTGRPTVLLTGDTAFLHDVGGLVWGARLGIPLTIVVVNNDGGRIFSFLPVANHPGELDRLFTMPHGVDLSHASRLAGVAHHRPTTQAELRRDLLQSLRGGTHVVEARVDGSRVRAEHDALWSRARAAVEGLG